MRSITIRSFVLSLLVVCSFPSFLALAQGGFDDDRVLLQGFYWESYRHGDPGFPQFGQKRWYEIVREKVPDIRDARFDLVWLPPPSYAGVRSAGYNPKEYYRLDNSYGSWDQHRRLLEALLGAGIEPVADVVINHRDGTNSWADFRNPDWGTWAVVRGDDAFYKADSPIKNTPESERGKPEETRAPYGGTNARTYEYGDFRDIDHTDPRVRRDIIRYLLQLKSAGYRGWRYDMVHGYHASKIALYNRVTRPTFSVGEYDWGSHAEWRGWIWYTATRANRLETASSVFDFTTHFTLEANKTDKTAWYGYGNGLGLIGDTTNAVAWKQRAVTFVENHDTGFRTLENGAPERDHEADSFQNNWEVEQAYAYVLTHPGVPSVFWKHYFDWGPDLRSRIKALINARKVAGVHSGSGLVLQENARQQGVYAAMVRGRHGSLFVRIGGDDAQWTPAASNYSNYREYAAGTGWKVWVALPGNPPVKTATAKPPLPVPPYQRADQINLPPGVEN